MNWSRPKVGDVRYKVFWDKNDCPSYWKCVLLRVTKNGWYTWGDARCLDRTWKTRTPRRYATTLAKVFMVEAMRLINAASDQRIRWKIDYFRAVGYKSPPMRNDFYLPFEKFLEQYHRLHREYWNVKTRA